MSGVLESLWERPAAKKVLTAPNMESPVLPLVVKLKAEKNSWKEEPPTL